MDSFVLAFTCSNAATTGASFFQLLLVLIGDAEGASAVPLSFPSEYWPTWSRRGVDQRSTLRAAIDFIDFETISYWLDGISWGLWVCVDGYFDNLREGH
jgi:hypothetical protein